LDKRLSPEQTDQIKKQLSEQIDKSFPADKKDFAKKQIQEMNGEQLEEFLKQNKLTVQEQGGLASEGGQEGQCIFCAITSGKMDSSKIDEVKEAIAVLEINPASHGHTLILPREHIESKDKLPESISLFAKKVSKRLKSKLKAIKIKIENSNLFGHEIINLIPVYKGDSESEEENRERKPADKAELAQLQKTLKEKPKPIPRKPEVQKIKSEEKIRLPKRIP